MTNDRNLMEAILEQLKMLWENPRYYVFVCDGDFVQGMVQANVGQKLLKRNKIKSFNRCPKLSSGHCPKEYKRITTTTPPYVILITNPPNKLYSHLSLALLFCLICNTPIENRGSDASIWSASGVQ
jgi:hypothetical protein